MRASSWIALFLAGCSTFSADLSFLKRHTEVIVLSEGNARAVVCPALQARVMTSTGGGDFGASYGWINYAHVASGKLARHMNVYGGEDRFWLGPEGGQFSVFFARGAPFDLEHWFTPAPVDSEPWELVRRTQDRATFRKRMALANYSGTKFELEVRRTVRLHEADRAWEFLGVEPLPGVEVVSFESQNAVTNVGKTAWRKETGLPSIWILGMFRPSGSTTVVVPIRPGAGPVVNDRYFGKVPADRLAVRDGVVYFKGDGQHRSKIGVPAGRAKPILGSYDAERRVLTLVHFTYKEGAEDYVNSMWELQKEPYRGDVVNSYNDGPAAPGAAPLGPFYELESSSPAAALAPGESLTHVHRTVHLEGPEEALDEVARKKLGVGLAEIKGAFGKE